MDEKEKTPAAVPQGLGLNEQSLLWHRFELTTSDPKQIEDLEQLLFRLNLKRSELALIVLSLRVRPEFALRDFDT